MQAEAEEPAGRPSGGRDRLLDARRQAERDAAEITAIARVLKQDVERRQRRLDEREERLAGESRRLGSGTGGSAPRANWT